MVSEVEHLQNKFMEKLDKLKPVKDALYYVKLYGGIAALFVSVIFLLKVSYSVNRTLDKVIEIETNQKTILKNYVTKDELKELEGKYVKVGKYRLLENSKNNQLQNLVKDLNHNRALLLREDNNHLEKYEIIIFNY